MDNTNGLKFLRVNEITDGDEVLILSTPKEETNKWNKKVWTFFIRHKEVDKILSINVLSPQKDRLFALLGLNTVGWIGQKVLARKQDVVLGSGLKVQALDFYK